MTILFSPACEYLFDHHKPHSSICEIDDPFWLSYGQTAECDDWAVTFTGYVQDSRCPSTVVCVWAGRVDISLKVGEDTITLGLPDDPEMGAAKDTIGNRVIELLEVRPVPVTADAIPQEDYKVRLVVTDL